MRASGVILKAFVANPEFRKTHTFLIRIIIKNSRFSLLLLTIELFI